VQVLGTMHYNISTVQFTASNAQPCCGNGPSPSPGPSLLGRIWLEHLKLDWPQITTLSALSADWNEKLQALLEKYSEGRTRNSQHFQGKAPC
jgi:hypothetical protein